MIKQKLVYHILHTIECETSNIDKISPIYTLGSRLGGLWPPKVIASGL